MPQDNTQLIVPGCEVDEHSLHILLVTLERSFAETHGPQSHFSDGGKSMALSEKRH